MKRPADVLSYVFDRLRLQGIFVSEWQTTTPWAIQGEQESCALLHYMIQGDAVIQMEGREPVTLHEGDLAMFPRGQGHSIGDALNSKPQELKDLLPERSAEKFSVLQFGGGGRKNQMLCAGLHFEADSVRLIYQLLPPLMIISAAQIETEPLLSHTLDGVKSELKVYGEGRNVVLVHGFELVYVLGLRVAMRDAGRFSRFSIALQHQGIGQALMAMHEDFARQWTLDSLAEEAGVSRSSFARTFKELVGETPRQHLVRHRLAEAQRLLNTTSLPLSDIAERIGYESVVGLHLAFNNHFGIPPGAYRKQHRTPLEVKPEATRQP
ncbi:AraC family transcriptional regulator [Aquabacterium sp. CECT 9606]|uniref:AraC family transcriptional regulator n=1 Tax=Aquabacterium sp. CECT 9606 TaxID=2845822 RepID=UPI001E37333D|nr:AraC family transcriptional regulator [Aquabacterium sp. CECT 9606]CAH0354879.1 RCS-specific HTH-type transcriptional activator RclR [Aquabacterium sp. CECT 9606]